MFLSWDRLQAIRALLPDGSPPRRRRFQERRLKRLLHHAAESVPYYRRLFQQCGFDPVTWRGLEDLGQVPLSSRSALQEAGLERRISERFGSSRLFQRRTSGSSGRPLTVCSSWFEESLLSIFRAQVFGRIGLRPWHRLARIGLRVAGRRPPGWVQRLQQAAVFRQPVIDCLQPPSTILEALRALQPDAIVSFPEILSRVAELSRPDLFRHLRFILVGGETVTPQALKSIHQGFDVRIVQGYASHEFGQIAVECPAGGTLHVNESWVLLEVLREGKPCAPGETGEAVVTALHSLAMPFIRFQLEDLVRLGPSPCPCGWPGKTLYGVEGRMADHLVCPDGRVLHSFALIHAFKDAFDWISQYQILQEEVDRIRIRIRCIGQPAASQFDDLKRRLSEVVGAGIRVQIEADAEFERTPGGKFRTCVSRVWQQRSLLGPPSGDGVHPGRGVGSGRARPVS